MTPASLHLLTMLMNCSLLPDLLSSLYETAWYRVHHSSPRMCSWGGDTWTQGSYCRIAQLEGENLNYATLAPQARQAKPSGEILNYLLTRQCYILMYDHCLDTTVSPGTQDSDTLLSHCVPWPLKQLDNGSPAALTVIINIVLSQSQRKQGEYCHKIL